MRQSGHFRANKRKNIQLRIYLLKKEKAKAWNIFLSIPGLSQGEKAEHIFWIYGKGNGRE